MTTLAGRLPVARSCSLSGARLELLESFVVLAEELHVGRAAGRLFLTQSGLSRRLLALETQLGVVLFTRTTREMELSHAGQILLPHARCLLDTAAAAARDLTLQAQPGVARAVAC